MPGEQESPGGSQGQLFGALFTVLVTIVLVLNWPINRHGEGLIQRIPNATPVVFYEGMVLQGSEPTVYALENHQLRPFASSESFQHFRARYQLVAHRVTEQQLTQFRPGRPIHRLVTCRETDDVFVLETGYRRPVLVLPTGGPASRWDSVEMIACHTLYKFPQGPSLRQTE
jgi:hypothetical protein